MPENRKLTLIEEAHNILHWPAPTKILEPSGAGPRIFSQLAKNKLERSIGRLADGEGVVVGVLSANPDSDETEPPIAVVCEFPRVVSDKTLRECHRLAWSFCRSPLLITLEPGILRAWTCCEPPSDDGNVFKPLVKEIVSSPLARLFPDDAESFLSQKAAESFRWVHLVSGEFFSEYEQRFKRERCADVLLLENLKDVRRQLRLKELSVSTIHDLLARLIFIQFLFHRKDSSGNAALSAEVLADLYGRGTLSTDAQDLRSILMSKSDTYNLFRWLNDKFNGDLFPGNGDTAEEREAEWQREIDEVSQAHLGLLADFVSGELAMKSGQRCLWPQYSFDAVPLDFISSIYEEFVRNGEPSDGVHYTPGHIVDFLLDGVLPWNSDQWNLKILDPACGSAIFLAKCFQRLIHRWKVAHNQAAPDETVLRQILERNLFGVDINPEAIRVASFSLYLVMCDEIDPRRYWLDWNFPRLRDHRLKASDFFNEHVEGFRTIDDRQKYDLVVGNAPWGYRTMTDLADEWVKNSGDYLSHICETRQSYALSERGRRRDKGDQWPITNKDIGPLFLAKSLTLTKEQGRVSILQPAGGILTNQIGTAKDLREKIFGQFQVDEVVNLSALRFGLFKDAISPSCIITLRPSPPTKQPFWYRCPKPVHVNEGDYRVIVEPHDNNLLNPEEAATNQWIWAALMWGNRRDLDLIQNLSGHLSLKKLEHDKKVVVRRGVSRGDKGKRQEEILGRRILEQHDFPEGTFLNLEADDLPVNTDPLTHSADSVNMEAFRLPQLIIKQAWQKKRKRFRAALVESTPETGGVFCSRSYVSVHAEGGSALSLEAACLSLNSKLAVYYLFLTSGRFASYRPEVTEEELLNVPLSAPRIGLLQNVDSYEDIDKRVQREFGLRESDWALVEDVFDFVLPNFKEGKLSKGRRATSRHVEGESSKRNEPELRVYCDYFIRVLKAGFGEGKSICATIFQEKGGQKHLPVRLVAVHFNWPHRSAVTIERSDYDLLWEKLRRIDELFLKRRSQQGGIFYQRVARIYDTLSNENVEIPTVFLIKPDQKSYWSRSAALRDADEIAAEIMMSGLEAKTIQDSSRKLKYG